MVKKVLKVRVRILTGVEAAAVVGDAAADDCVVEVVCVGKRGGNDNVGRCHSESGMPATRVSTMGLISGISEGIGIGKVIRAGSRASRACGRVDPCLFTRRFACMVTWWFCQERRGKTERNVGD